MVGTSYSYILVRSFPECAVMLLVGAYLLKVKLSTKVLLKKTLILGLIISVIRVLPISFGIHTIIGMSCVLYELYKLSGSSFLNCLIALSKIFISLTISEFVYISLLTRVFSVGEDLLIGNYTVLGAIYTLPSLIIFIAIAYFIEFLIQYFFEGRIIKYNG